MTTFAAKEQEYMNQTEQAPNVESILKAIRSLPEKDLLYLLCNLAWNNFVNYSKKTIQEQKAVLLNFALTIAKRVTYDMIPARPAVPLLAAAGKNQSLKLT
jgi:hypothetical protein